MRIELKNGNLGLSEMYDEFIEEKGLGGLTQKTMNYYEYYVGVFVDWAKEYDKITKSAVLEYIKYLQSGNRNNITINTYLRAIRTFVYWGIDKGYVEPFKINLLKADEPLKRTYTEQELKILLKRPTKFRNFCHLQTWALENFLIGTGCRISSAIEVRIGDLDFDTYKISFPKNKSRKALVVPMSKQLAVVLREYLRTRKGVEDDIVFCSLEGGTPKEYNLQRHIREYNKRLGVSLTSCHAFRHTFAKMYIMNGGDAFRLQRLLGHSSLETTKRYVSLYGGDLGQDYDRLNPLDNLTMKKKRIKLDGEPKVM